MKEYKFIKMNNKRSKEFYNEHKEVIYYKYF